MKMIKGLAAAGVLSLGLVGSVVTATGTDAAGSTITVNPNPTGYYKLTTFTAHVGVGASNCGIEMYFQETSGGAYVYHNFPSRSANSRGVVVWKLRIPQPTVGVRTKYPWNVDVSCNHGGAMGSFRVNPTKVTRKLTRTQILYAYWRKQLNSNSYDCFNHLNASFPDYADDAEQIVTDCTTGFLPTPPPSDLILDSRIQSAYNDYISVAQEEASIASNAISSGTVHDDDWLQAGRDEGHWDNEMSTLDQVYQYYG